MGRASLSSSFFLAYFVQYERKLYALNVYCHATEEAKNWSRGRKRPLRSLVFYPTLWPLWLHWFPIKLSSPWNCPSLCCEHNGFSESQHNKGTGSLPFKKTWHWLVLTHSIVCKLKVRLCWWLWITRFVYEMSSVHTAKSHVPKLSMN